MPTYEYLCEACGKKFEKFQSITAPALKKCPHCGRRKLRRLIGAGAGMIFKGSGFYITDYRDSAYKEKAKADAGASAGDSKTDSKTDGKSDSKTESKPSDATATDKPAESKATASEQPTAKPAKVEKPKKK